MQTNVLKNENFCTLQKNGMKSIFKFHHFIQVVGCMKKKDLVEYLQTYSVFLKMYLGSFALCGFA